MSDYRAYAGIGSRRTPNHICNIMHYTARFLFGLGWTLRSGGAQGADQAFELGANFMAREMRRDPLKEIYLPWPGFENSKSLLHPGNYPFSDEEFEFASKFHPAWSKCSGGARKMHTRNVRQILGMQAIHGELVKPVHFVVCWTEQGRPEGGTAQAIRIAESLSIPVINLGKAKNTDELEALLKEVERLAVPTAAGEINEAHHMA